jgi:hypothetical protein
MPGEAAREWNRGVRRVAQPRERTSAGGYRGDTAAGGSTGGVTMAEDTLIWDVGAWDVNTWAPPAAGGHWGHATGETAWYAVGGWNAYSMDTPRVVTDDITCGTFLGTNNQLWMYFAGAPDSDNWGTGLAQAPLTGASLDRQLERIRWSASSDTAVTISTAQAHGGGQSALIHDASAATAYSLKTNSFDPQDTATFSVWMRKGNTTTTCDMYLYSGTALCALAGFSSGAKFRYHNGTSFTNTAVAYAANTWYRLDLEYNRAAGTFNFVARNTALAELVRADSIALTAANNLAPVDNVAFISSSSGVDDIYVDDFSVTNGRGIVGRGSEDFEGYTPGAFTGQEPRACAPWDLYASNPVVATGADNGSGCVLKVGSTYHNFYGWSTSIRHSTSTDGVTWGTPTTAIAVGGVCVVWIEGATWYMLYRHAVSGPRIGVYLATSADGTTWTNYGSNPVYDEAAAWPARGSTSGIEPYGLIKVGATYYLYYSCWGVLYRAVGVATSTDLHTWTPYASNPVFSGGRFCGSPFTYGGYYYFLVPHYTTKLDATAGNEAELELYRDTSPYFSPDTREFVRVVGATGAENAAAAGAAAGTASGMRWDFSTWH